MTQTPVAQTPANTIVEPTSVAQTITLQCRRCGADLVFDNVAAQFRLGDSRCRRCNHVGEPAIVCETTSFEVSLETIRASLRPQ